MYHNAVELPCPLLLILPGQLNAGCKLNTVLQCLIVFPRIKVQTVKDCISKIQYKLYSATDKLFFISNL